MLPDHPDWITVRTIPKIKSSRIALSGSICFIQLEYSTVSSHLLIPVEELQIKAGIKRQYWVMIPGLWVPIIIAFIYSKLGASVHHDFYMIHLLGSVIVIPIFFSIAWLFIKRTYRLSYQFPELNKPVKLLLYAKPDVDKLMEKITNTSEAYQDMPEDDGHSEIKARMWYRLKPFRYLFYPGLTYSFVLFLFLIIPCITFRISWVLLIASLLPVTYKVLYYLWKRHLIHKKPRLLWEAHEAFFSRDDAKTFTFLEAYVAEQEDYEGMAFLISMLNEHNRFDEAESLCNRMAEHFPEEAEFERQELEHMKMLWQRAQT